MSKDDSSNMNGSNGSSTSNSSSNLKGLSRQRKYMILVILIFAGAICYELPYFRYTYYTPLQDALGLQNNNTALGNLGSIYGILNLILYLPSGYIADKFSPKKMLVFSLVATGILGCIFAFWPSYPVACGIFVAWAFTTVFTFWSAYIKIVNIMSTSDEQGEMFGWLEGGRGIVTMIYSFVGLWLFSFLGSKSSSLTVVFLIYSITVIVTGILVQIYIPEVENVKEDVGKITVKNILKAFTYPVTWLLGFTILAAFMLLSGSSYLTPYMEVGFGLSAALSGTLYAIRANGIKFISAPIFGYLSKASKSSARVIKWAFVLLVAITAAFIFVPGNPAFLIPMIVITLLLGFFNYGIRGVYWVLIDELKTPEYMVGTVIGIASIIGFIPDAFIYTIFGNILDKYDTTQAYHIIFIILMVSCVVGAVTGFAADALVKKNKGKEAQKEQLEGTD